jgi:elongation factor Ts
MLKMAEITASMVKELREKSGAAMMDCKKALVETSGDFEKAFEWLRQKGVATANKKASRTTSEGIVVGRLAESGKKACLVELNCETDFVARNEEFVNLANKIADLALAGEPSDVEALTGMKDGGKTVAELITDGIAKTGENIVVKRVKCFNLKGPGILGLYVHALGGKMGAIVELSAGSEANSESGKAFARELAMHIVSAKPEYLTKEGIPQHIIDDEYRIEAGKADLAGKKDEIKDKIVKGRVEKNLSERCLTLQPFVKDPGQTVEACLNAKSKELGTELTPTSYALFILGQGEE